MNGAILSRQHADPLEQPGPDQLARARAVELSEVGGVEYRLPFVVRQKFSVRDLAPPRIVDRARLNRQVVASLVRASAMLVHKGCLRRSAAT